MTRTPPLDGVRLADAKVCLRDAGPLVFALNASSRPAEIRAARTAIQDVANRLDNLHGPVPATGCHRHPRGPVDPVPPDGWSNCMLCNNARRRADGPARRPA